MSANDSLKDALTVARDNVPAPSTGNPGTNSSQAPVRAPEQRPVQGQPDIKDKTSQGQQADQGQMVPLAELQKLRKKNQDLEQHIRSGNQTVGELRRNLASLTGELNGLKQAQQIQQSQPQAPVQQREQLPAPDPMLEPDAFTQYVLDQTAGVIMQEVDRRMVGLATDVFNQRMVWSDRDAKSKYGADTVARATQYVVDKGRQQEAMADFHPTEWSVLFYSQQNAMSQLPTAANGQVDLDAFRKQVIGQAFQDPNFWQAAVQNPNVQSALTNAMRQPGTEQPQQPQAPAQQPVPQFQAPQGQPLPQSMANQPGAANTNVVPMPNANDDLRNALVRPSNPRANMGIG